MLDLESLFNLSYPMCIISSVCSRQYNGCIVNSVFQITPEPPMIAISMNRENLTCEYILKSRVLAVSVLDEQAPMEFIGSFGFRSGRGINKFQAVNFKTDLTKVPIILENTGGFVEVEVTDAIDIETHTLFIGRIVASETIDPNKTPMTYNYYRDAKQGRTPRTAATYVDLKKKPETNQGVKKMEKYRCLMCSYIYDPDIGDPENGVDAGTSFDNLPNDWVCPECGAGKDEFEPVNE